MAYFPVREFRDTEGGLLHDWYIRCVGSRVRFGALLSGGEKLAFRVGSVQNPLRLQFDKRPNGCDFSAT